ncbi:MAG: formyltransferase family protein, partial [Arenimonas sp.]
MSLRIAVLASGRGSNLRALFEAQQKGLLQARIVGVFSDRDGCDAIAFARRHDLFTSTLRPRDFPSRETFDEALFSQIELVQADLIVFAGYMRLVSQRAVQRFEGRIINIHPSLLP